MKKLFSITIMLALTVSAFTQNRVFDFSAVCESGQTLYYKIYSSSSNQVGLAPPGMGNWNGYTKPVGDLVIPETVEHEGTIYTVVHIWNYTFLDCDGLTSVVIPNSVNIICNQTFVNCTNLSNLVIGASVNSIEEGAFINCSGLQTIYCYAQNPPVYLDVPYLNIELFHNAPTDIPIYVSCYTIDLYHADPSWSRFTNLQAEFVGTYPLTVNVNNPSFGTAEIVSIPENCDSQTATVRATPNPNHRFSYWKNGISIVSFDSEFTFILNENYHLTACFDCLTNADTIAFPDHVVGRKINASGQVTEEYPADFSYREDGVLTKFLFPGWGATQYSFAHFPSRPSEYNSTYGDHPTVTERYTFSYNTYDQITQLHAFFYGMGNYVAHDYYYYDEEHRPIKIEYNDEIGCVGRLFYAYLDGNRTRTDSLLYYYSNSGNLYKITQTTNHFNQRLQPLTVQTDTYNGSGELLSSKLQIYSYTPHHKTDSVITQTLNEGEWVNSGIAHYVYDNLDRVVEYQTGPWSTENNAWNITKKIIYDFDDNAQTLTVSFRKKNAGEWVWDVFSDQTLFYDSELDVWQHTLSCYNNYSINQFTFSQHYVTMEITFPRMSEWYYEIQNDNGSITYQHLEYVADTTIGTHRPKIIIRSNTQYDKDLHTEVTHEYIYEENGKVYWWNKDLQEFTTLYDYAAEAGDEWEIKVGTESITMHVDGVDAFEYDGEYFKRLHISDVGDVFSGDIVVGFGHMTSFFPEKLMNRNADFTVDGLRCYWMEDALLYHQGEEDCDAIYAELHGVDEDGPSTGSGTFVVYPNPARGVLFVRLPQCDSPTTGKTGYRITNLMGQTLLQGSSNAENQQIDISALPSGMYFISIGEQTVKFVKQ